MKKIILFSALFIFALNAKTTPIPLNGFYIKIQLNAGQQINTQQLILYPKVVPPDPTTWYFGHVKQGIIMNGDRIDWDNVITLTFIFEQYYDYYEYWNGYKPFDMAVPTNMYTTDWIDISDECTDLTVIVPQQIALMYVKMLNADPTHGTDFDISQVQVLDFYNP